MLLDGPFYNKPIVLDIFRSFHMKLSRVLHIGSVALCVIFISIILSNNSPINFLDSYLLNTPQSGIM